jgi:hypothetical protein
MNCEHYYVDIPGGLGSMFGDNYRPSPGARVRISEVSLVCTEYFGPAERISDGVRGWFSNGAFSDHPLAEQTYHAWNAVHSQMVVTVKDRGPAEIARLASTLHHALPTSWILTDPEIDIRPLYPPAPKKQVGTVAAYDEANDQHVIELENGSKIFVKLSSVDTPLRGAGFVGVKVTADEEFGVVYGMLEDRDYTGISGG